MKKVGFLALISVFAFSCANQDQMVALQRDIIQMKEDIASLKTDTKNNKEAIETLTTRVDKLSQKVSENSIEIEKLKSSKKQEQVETKEKLPKPEELPKEGAEKVKVPEGEKELYQYALDLYFKGDLTGARQYFYEFLKKYPNSDLYGNAIFWSAQTFFAEGKYEDSIKLFQALIDKCDKGEIKKCNKYPAALLKLGYAYINIGDKEKGKEYLNKVIQMFPNTEEAGLATKKLGTLQ